MFKRDYTQSKDPGNLISNQSYRLFSLGGEELSKYWFAER